MSPGYLVPGTLCESPAAVTRAARATAVGPTPRDTGLPLRFDAFLYSLFTVFIFEEKKSFFHRKIPRRKRRRRKMVGPGLGHRRASSVLCLRTRTDSWLFTVHTAGPAGTQPKLRPRRELKSSCHSLVRTHTPLFRPQDFLPSWGASSAGTIASAVRGRDHACNCNGIWRRRVQCKGMQVA